MNQQKPIKNFRAGKIQASIWKNEKDRDGKTILQHSVHIQKQFRNDDGDYQDTDYFFPNELPELELVTRKAYEYIKLKESESEDADS